MIWLALVLLVGANVADWWTTNQSLAAGNQELNPLGRWLFVHIGLTGVGVLKVLLSAVVCFCAWESFRHGAEWAVAVPFALSAIIGAVAWHNWKLAKG